MSRRVMYIIGVLVLMGLSAGVGVAGYILTVGGSGEASATISAPTLAIPTPNQAGTQVAQLSTQVADLIVQNATLSAATGSGLPIPTAAATTETTAPTGDTTSTTGAIFRIVPEESEVRFSLMEDLLGKENLVVGRTDQVAGDIFIDMATPANSQVGTIRVNVRTLITDSEFRNRALRTQILQSTQPDYEYSDFTPTSISGMPATVEVGQEITFQVAGDLKVRDIVQPVTFEVTASLTTADRLEGKATAGVTRAQYNLQIPNAPGVANVADDVTLEIDFVAARVQQ